MKHLFTLLLAGICLYCQAQNDQPVNAVLGDRSFIERYGVAPDEAVPEQVRIQTHLSYVENLLRNRDVSQLTTQQQQNRALLLHLLHQYWTNGQFPANYDYPNERRPCFIDRDGNICAVGYLVQQTAGNEAAEQINVSHQYDYIADMNEAMLVAWVMEYGITLEECALIQPQYDWQPQPAPTVISRGISKDYGIGSAVLGGTNLALSVMNLSYRGNSKTMPTLGIITGISSIILGASNIDKSSTRFTTEGTRVTTNYKAQNNLSYFNMAMGTASVVSGTLNLLLNRKNRSTAFNVYGNGISIVKRI